MPLIAVVGLVAMGLPLESAGRAELLLAGASLTAVLSPLGTDQAIKLARYRFASRSILAALVIAATLAVLIGAAIMTITESPWSTLWWLAVILGVVAAVSRVATERMRVDDSLLPLAISTTLALGGVALVVAIGSRNGANTATLPVAAVVIAFALSALPLALILRALGRESQGPQIRKMLAFGMPLVMAGASIWILGVVDRYMLFWLSDIEEVGQYAVTARIVMLYSGVLSTVVVWWRNESFRQGAGASLERAHSVALRAFLLSACVALLLVAPLGNLVVRMVDYDSATEAFSIVAALLIGIVAWLVASLQLAPLTVAGHTRAVGATWAAAAGVNVGLNLILIPAWGPFGAAVATAISLTFAAFAASHSLNNRRRLAIVADPE